MNGVRRFLGGGSTPTQPAPPTPPKAQAPVPGPEQAAFVHPGKPTWPPQPDEPASSPRAMPTAVSSPATPALSIRNKTRSLVPDDRDPYRSPPPMNTPPRSTYNINGSPLNGLTLTSSPNGSPSLSSSPTRIPPPSMLPPLKTGNSDSVAWRRTSGLLNIRDDLLVSLLSSEAVVDSRECEILSGEEVEELKKEHQMLSTRLLAMQKKLSLETKIRDAALNLSRVNAPHKTVSRQTEEQVAAAERKVDEAQKELWRVADRANDVQRRLLEHRAGVLGYTVSKMERTMAPPQLPPHLPFDDDYAANGIGSGGPSTPSRALSPGASSVASATSATTHSSAARFDGAHLFAGHAQAQLPRAPPSVVEVLALEARLRKATDALADANRRQAESARELAHLRLEKAQVEATMSMELQSAEENAAALETELRPRLEGLLAEREAWEADRARLEEREEEVERLEGRLEALEERSGESVESTRVLETALEEARAERDAAQQRAEGLEREVERARQEKDEQQIAQTPYEGPPMEYTGDSAALVAQLQPLWDALPAPEARMSKFRAQRHLRGPSGASSANASSAPPSPAPGKATTLSDNDVRSLRTLYDTAGVPGASKAGFSVEALVGRVQALVADDRALIDRLIRSAQAHEMLKRNAERAQKLAEDGNAALQMYQDQVNELEDENMRLVARGDELSTEIRHLRDTLDQARATSSIGAPAVNGNGNDAGGATAAVEAAERAKAAAEAQLRRTEEELDSVRAAQGQLQMSLMNEMTDLQTENDNLRAQLRARK